MQGPTAPKKAPIELCQLMPLVSHLGNADVKWMVQRAPSPSTNRGVTADSEVTSEGWESHLPCKRSYR